MLKDKGSHRLGGHQETHQMLWPGFELGACDKVCQAECPCRSSLEVSDWAEIEGNWRQ